MTRSKFQAAVAGVALVSALASTAFPGIAHAAQPQQRPRTSTMSCYIGGRVNPAGVKLWSEQNQVGLCILLYNPGAVDLTATNYPSTNVLVYSSIASYDTGTSANTRGYFSCTPGPDQIFTPQQKANLSPGCVNSAFEITIKTY